VPTSTRTPTQAETEEEEAGGEEEGESVLGGILASALAFLNRYTAVGVAAAALLTFFVVYPRALGVVVYAFTSSASLAQLAGFEARLVGPAFYALLIIPFAEGARRYTPRKRVVKLRYRRVEVEVEEGAGFTDRLTRWILGREHLRKLRDTLEEAIRIDLLAAGDTGATATAGRAVSNFIVSCIVVGAAGAALALLLPAPLRPAALGVLAIPPTVLYSPVLEAKNKKMVSSEGLQDELPFFVALATIMASAGLSLYHALRTVATHPLFRYIGREAKIVVRDVQFFAKSPEEAMDERAVIHPNKTYQRLITGYTSMSLSGGDTTTYLYERSKEQLDWLTYRWRHFAQNVSTLGEMSIMGFLVVPTILLTVAAFVGTTIMALLPLLTVVFAVALYSAVNASRPKYLDVVRVNLGPPIGVSATLTAALLVARVQPYIALAAALLTAGLLLTAQTAPQFRHIQEVEDALPQFLRDITEYRKVGVDVAKAMEYLREKKYPPAFRQVLADYLHQIRMGLSFDEAEAHTASWTGRFAFYVVQTLVRMGEVPPRLLEQLTEFLTGVGEAKKQAKAEMNMYRIFTYMSPIILAFTTLMTVVMIQGFSGIPTGGLGGTVGGIGGFGLPQLRITPQMMQLIDVFIVLTGFAMGLVTSKAVYGSIFNMSIAITSTAIALVTIAAANALTPMIAGGFGFSVG
jgi:Bacterial type II secretion system protein F domain.